MVLPFRKLLPVLRLSQQAYKSLQANDPVRMAGATAFFTFFALPPIVVILSHVLSPVVSQGQFRWNIFNLLAEVFGRQSAAQLQVMSQNLQRQKPNFVLIVLSGFILLLASTTLFAVIKNSLNQLWRVKAKPERRVLHLLKDRLVAMSFIVFSGVLFSASLTLDHSLGQLKDYVAIGSFVYPAWMLALGNFLVSVVIVTIWFAFIFKFLPDVRIRWQAVWLGALVTSVLFKLGELILNRFLIEGPLSSVYGASGAVILMLLFVFYSALIFYYGAAFTRSYAEFSHLDLEPKADAVGYKIKELQTRRPKNGRRRSRPD